LAARLGIDGDIAEVVGAAREKVHAIYQNALERYGGG
jgi:hypothetical protein